MSNQRRANWSRGWLTLAIVAALAAGGGWAFAATTTSNGVIHACSAKHGGALRLARVCHKNERAISWNVRGIRGKNGANGTNGAPETSAPQFLTVDCGAGQSVNKALDGAGPTEPVTITIKGICNEAVFIGRDDVTLKANAPGDGIAAPAGASSALSLNGAQRVTLNQLTLTGGTWTLLASNGSGFYGDGLKISGATNTSVAIDLGTSGQLHNPTVDNSNQGVNVSAGGSLSIDGGTVSNSATFGVSTDGGHLRLGGGLVISHSSSYGVFATHGGTVEAGDTTVETSGQSGVLAYNGSAIHLFGNGVLVDHNSGQGVEANGSAAVQIQNGVRITNNALAGVSASGDSSLQIGGATITGTNGQGVALSLGSTAEIDGTTITGNSADGVYVADTSVVQFDGSNTITGNGGWGVTCQGTPAVAMMHGQPGTVSGNTIGRVNCPNV